MKKQYAVRALFASLAAGSGILLSGCNDGGGATGGGVSASAAPLTAQASNSLFSTSSCLTGSFTASGSSIWYINDTLTLTNSCSSAQDLSKQSISFTSQDTAGKSVAVGTLNNWWYNNSAYAITFAAGSGNQQVGTITAGNGSPSLPANSAITFTGGMNLNGAAYNSTLATSSFAVNGSSTPTTTGTLNVVVDTTAAGCTGTTVCSGLTVNVNNSSGTSVANFTVPAANLGGAYTVPVTNLTSGSTYSVSATPITSTTVSYTPTTATISATESKTITVKYTPSASVGSATVSLPTYLAAYTRPLQVKIINTALESSPVVNTYSVTQGSSFATGDLPVSDSKHVYKVVMTTGIANPATGAYYYESSVPTLTITKGSTSTLSISMAKVATTNLKNVTLVESGLVGSDTAVTTFSDSTSKYSYVNTAGIANGSVVYKVESGLLFGTSTLASGSNTYTTNPIVNTATINAAKTFNATFVKAVSSGILYSPYKDMTINMNWNTYVGSTAVTGSTTTLLAAIPSKVSTVTWAFATGNCGSENWGGIAGASLASANVPLFVTAGKKYVVSTGGAAGAFTCDTNANMKTFLDRYMSANLVGLDFDIEASLTQAQITSLVNTLVYAKTLYPNLRISFTIASLADSSGTGASVNALGAMVVNTAKSAGLDAYYNLMVMDYGSASAVNCVLSGSTCDMGQSAIQAAKNFSAGYSIPLNRIELTPMIGDNDTRDEIFTLANADTLSTYVVNNNLAGVHFWSFDRDTPCASTISYASPTCNNVDTTPLQFTNEFAKYFQ